MLRITVYGLVQKRIQAKNQNTLEIVRAHRQEGQRKIYNATPVAQVVKTTNTLPSASFL